MERRTKDVIKNGKGRKKENKEKRKQEKRIIRNVGKKGIK
jgi:hypothetical protein